MCNTLTTNTSHTEVSSPPKSNIGQFDYGIGMENFATGLGNLEIKWKVLSISSNWGAWPSMEK